MSLAYDSYLSIHRACVQYGLDWIFNNLSQETINDILPDLPLYSNITFDEHDISKNTIKEYDAYDNYFYQGGYSTEEGREAFDLAFLHHIHNNPHHWHYWVLVDDDSHEHSDGVSLKALEIPDIYILEMICDWWSFSWKKYFELLTSGTSSESNRQKALYEVYDWYDSHKNSIVMHKNTRDKVEKLLEAIKNRIPYVDIPVDRPY